MQKFLGAANANLSFAYVCNFLYLSGATHLSAIALSLAGCGGHRHVEGRGAGCFGVLCVHARRENSKFIPRPEGRFFCPRFDFLRKFIHGGGRLAFIHASDRACTCRTREYTPSRVSTRQIRGNTAGCGVAGSVRGNTHRVNYRARIGRLGGRRASRGARRVRRRAAPGGGAAGGRSGRPGGRAAGANVQLRRGLRGLQSCSAFYLVVFVFLCGGCYRDGPNLRTLKRIIIMRNDLVVTFVLREHRSPIYRSDIEKTF